MNRNHVEVSLVIVLHVSIERTNEIIGQWARLSILITVLDILQKVDLFWRTRGFTGHKRKQKKNMYTH